MARLDSLSRRGAVFAAALAAVPAAASAQAYPVLHVTALAQHADRTAVEPNGRFHVTIHVRVAEHRARLDELVLGRFDGCTLVSDERVHVPLPGGTDFIERLTVEAGASGDATITPAYLDAVDPAAGKPLRYSSNAIRVRIAGSPLRAATDALAGAVRLAVGIFGVVAAAVVLVLLFGMRRTRERPVTTPPPGVPATVLPAPPTLDERLAGATQAYRRTRDPASLAALRMLLFDAAGARPGATLSDALYASGDGGPLAGALRAADVATFGPSADRARAGDELLAALEAYSGAPAANVPSWTR